MRNPIRAYLSKIGRRGGKIGGRAQTPAQKRAAKKNLAQGPKHLRTEKLCKRCKRERLGVRNKSGVCRKCQRKAKEN